MSPQITAALIAAAISFVGAILTLIIGLRNTRIQRENLQLERERLLRQERESAEQARRWEAEIAKLKAEGNKLIEERANLKAATDKVIEETLELQRRRFEAERAEIRDLLKLFDRAVFDAPMYSEEPVEMFRAIRQTRISLQTSGASLVRDIGIAEAFTRARRLLLEIETEVMTRYPNIPEMVLEIGDRSIDYDRREQVRKKLGEDYWEAVRLMMGVRREIDVHVEHIRNRLRDLDMRFN